METTAPSPDSRPLRNAPQVIHKAAELLLPDVMEWLNDDDYQSEHVLEMLKRAIRYATDGYAIAKAIDQNECLDPDAELVEILDQASSHLRTAYSEVCTAWVKENNLIGPTIGAQVKCTPIRNEETGVIIRNTTDGRSLVYIEALGHVKEGTGCHGTYLPWETLTNI